MANMWFRMYFEWADDPKVQMLSEAMQRRLAMLFCSRCKGETLHETERAFHWRISAAELAETKALFIEKEFMDEDWNLLNWNKRQFISDSSTDRVHRHRERMKQVETLPKRIETLQEQSVTQSVTAPDTDTDTEAEQKQNKEKQKPYRSKVAIDPRHAEFRSAYRSYFLHKNRGLQREPWDGQEAAGLSRLLKKNPDLTLAQWQLLLTHRARSPVAHGENLSTWVANSLKWLNGPTDAHGKPINKGKHGHPNRTEQIAKSSIEALAILWGSGYPADSHGGASEAGPDARLPFEGGSGAAMDENDSRDRP